VRVSVGRKGEGKNKKTKKPQKNKKDKKDKKDKKKGGQQWDPPVRGAGYEPSATARGSQESREIPPQTAPYGLPPPLDLLLQYRIFGFFPLRGSRGMGLWGFWLWGLGQWDPQWWRGAWH